MEEIKPIDFIETEEENRVALRIIERLMAYDPDPSSPSGQLLRELAAEVEKFEKKMYEKTK